MSIAINPNNIWNGKSSKSITVLIIDNYYTEKLKKNNKEK